MLLVVGYDPGSNFSLSLIDAISGKLILLYSGKNKNINFIIRKILQYGTPLCIGFDKKVTNKNIINLSRKLGILVISPNEDLKIEKKRRMTGEYIKEQTNRYIYIKNKHEFDSLASAIFAYKKIRSLINKLKNKLSEENKIKDVLFLLLKKNVTNTKEALQKYGSVFCQYSKFYSYRQT